MSDDDRKRESHIGDALAHAMIPPTEAAPAEPAPPRAEPDPMMESAIAQDEVIEDVIEAMSDDDPHAVQSGATITQLERLWPLIWLAMLTVVCVIGIYNAVRMLP